MKSKNFSQLFFQLVNNVWWTTTGNRENRQLLYSSVLWFTIFISLCSNSICCFSFWVNLDIDFIQNYAGISKLVWNSLLSGHEIRWEGWWGRSSIISQIQGNAYNSVVLRSGFYFRMPILRRSKEMEASKYVENIWLWLSISSTFNTK